MARDQAVKVATAPVTVSTCVQITRRHLQDVVTAKERMGPFLPKNACDSDAWRPCRDRPR
jgi:hypothetical protein